MKITIINGERPEKRYSRVEIVDFVEQLRNGTYRLENTSRDSRKEVCFAAEWHKQQGELKVRCINQLILCASIRNRLPDSSTRCFASSETTVIR